MPGFRTLLFTTGRQLPDELTAPARDTLIGIDPKWGERETWAAIRRAGGPVTDFYLLGALDLRRDADGSIIGAPPEQRVFRDVLGRTLWISAMVTLICLLLGYPVAYVIAAQPPGRAGMLLFLVLLPFWTSLLVRTVAWVVLLQKEGVLNSLFMSLGLVHEPLKMIYNRFAVYVAMVHVLLPFMVLPLYSVMRGIPPSYVRAASSLGAKPFTAFRRVFVPQTLAGIGAGCLMVFIQALGYYITPALVGGAEDQMISYFIAFYASKTVNWGMAAALSIMLLTATLAALRGVQPHGGRRADAAGLGLSRKCAIRPPHSANASPASASIVLTGAVLLFLVAPILTIVPLSFSSGSFFYYPLPGLSLRWYEDFFTSSFWLLVAEEQPDRRHLGDGPGDGARHAGGARHLARALSRRRRWCWRC